MHPMRMPAGVPVASILVVALLAGCADLAGNDSPPRRADNHAYDIVFVLRPATDRIVVQSAEPGANWYWLSLRVDGTATQWNLDGAAEDGRFAPGDTPVRISRTDRPLRAGQYFEFCAAADFSAQYTPTFIDTPTGHEYSFAVPVALNPCTS